MKAEQVTYEIVYNGKNITGDIEKYVLGLTYSDKATGETDELEIQLEDSSGLWQLDWYPAKGDTIIARIKTISGVLECGTFTIDETSGSFTSDGDIISIKGLAAGINKSMRTVKFYAHEKKSLREIANTIASKNGLTLEGSIPDVTIERKTQYQLTDLHFLQKLANDYGYTFSVRDNRMTFTNIFELEGREASLSFRRDEIYSLSVTDKTSETYKSVEIKYKNPKQNTVLSHAEDEKNEAFSGVKGDKLVLRKRIENKQQAEILSKVALYRMNSLQQSGSFDTKGNIYVVAGNNVELFGFGMYSGKYHIKESSHSVSKMGGYTTSAEIKRVGLVDKSNYK